MKNSMFLKLLSFYKLLLRYNLHTYVPRSITNKIIASQFEDKLYSVEGHQMYLNEGLFSLSLGEPFEPMETSIVKALVRKGDKVVDLGANIGYYTLLFARQVGQDGKVVAFEPSPTNCKILEKNVKINGYANVVINQLAVADRSGNAKLKLTPNPADARIRPANSNSDEGRSEISNNTLEIKTISLDDYFYDKGEEINFIKMDIQGSEYRAFLGMQRVISKSKNIQILTEFFPKLLRESGIDPSDYLKILQENKFNIYRLDEKDSRIKRANTFDLVSQFPEKSESYTNLLLSRRNVEENLRDLCV